MATRGRGVLFGAGIFLGVVVVAAMAAYGGRDNLLRYTLNPSRGFGEGAQATAPDYSNAVSWAQLPQATKQVDVFFIYPTTYFSGEYWNAPISNDAVRERLSHVIDPLYVAPFTTGTNIFMPLYRQAAPYTFMGSSEDGRKARELAYTDVAAAFKAFLKERNAGRPFIIAGYGQGALYGFRLIGELEPDVRRRMIAAYLIEVAIPVEIVSPSTPLCDSPDQTGCMVIWVSTTQHGRGDLARQNALVWKPGGGFDATRGRELACVNPLTWSISGRAGSADMNLGSAELSEFATGGTIVTRGVTSADCWNGLLFTDVTPDPIFFWAGPRYREMFPSRINPFFSDIKDNVARRIESFAAQASLPEPPKAEEELEPETTNPDVVNGN